MTSSTLRFGITLGFALMASAAAVAQDQAPELKTEDGKVQTMVRLSETGTPIERFWVDRKVSYADLDLTTASGAAELMKRVSEAAKEACEQVRTADPLVLSDMDGAACVRTATGGALKQAKAAIDQRRKLT
jgi:UrcA family protein